MLDFFVLRHLFGQSQTAVVILTIALGFVIRFIAGAIWGHEPQTLESPLALGDVKLGGVVLGMADVAVIVVTVLLTLFLYQFFQRTKLGLAMQAASQNQMAAYYMGVPVKKVQGLIWGLVLTVVLGLVISFVFNHSPTKRMAIF